MPNYRRLRGSRRNLLLHRHPGRPAGRYACRPYRPAARGLCRNSRPASVPRRRLRRAARPSARGLDPAARRRGFPGAVENAARRLRPRARPGPVSLCGAAPRREKGIWQRRYWEHLIRDADDYRAHVEYCWWNPVKHGLAAHPADWPHSSFRRGGPGSAELVGRRRLRRGGHMKSGPRSALRLTLTPLT